jgi:hypothetical protein
MNSQDPVYILHVIDVHGNSYRVHGIERQLRPTYDAWKNASFEASGKLIVKGFAEDWDRSPVEMAMERDSIKGMILARA